MVVGMKAGLETKRCKLCQRNRPTNGRFVPEIVAGEFDMMLKGLVKQQTSSLRMHVLFTQLRADRHASLLLMLERGCEVAVLHM